MEYEGKLYMNIGGKFIDSGKTSKDWDELEKSVEDRAKRIIDINSELSSYRSYDKTWKEMCDDYQKRTLKSEHVLGEINRHAKYALNKC